MRLSGHGEADIFYNLYAVSRAMFGFPEVGLDASRPGELLRVDVVGGPRLT